MCAAIGSLPIPTRLGARKRCSDTRRFRLGFLLRGQLQASWNTPAIPQKTHVSIELQHGRPAGASLRFPEAISSFRDDAERLPFPRNSGSVFRRAKRPSLRSHAEAWERCPFSAPSQLPFPIFLPFFI